MLATKSEAYAFCAHVKNHWKDIVGGSAVFLLLGTAASLGFDVPKTVTAVAVLFAAVALAAFLAWRDEHRENESLLADRRTATDECFDRAIAFMKGSNGGRWLPMNALYMARAHELPSNDQVNKVCSRLVESNHGKPFEGLDMRILPTERLDFLRWAHTASGVDLATGADYLRAAESWSELRGRKLPPLPA